MYSHTGGTELIDATTALIAAVVPGLPSGR